MDCRRCRKTFPDRKSLKDHRNTPKCVDRVPCAYCEKYFCNKQSRIRHMESGVCRKKKPVFKCSLCDRAFSSKQMLNKHVDHRVCQRKKEFKCHLCDRAFSSKQMMNKHLKNQSCRKTTQCSYCKKTFSTPFNLRRHPCVNHFCGDWRWHRARCTMAYESPKAPVEELVLMKKERDSLLYHFDEEMPWECQWWWNEVCEVCGCRKKELRHLECIREKYLNRLRSWFYGRMPEEEQERYENNYYYQKGDLEYLRKTWKEYSHRSYWYPQSRVAGEAIERARERIKHLI